MIFGPQRGDASDVRIPAVMVDGARVATKSVIKYLGLMIDSKWTFEKHFEYAANKARRVAAALSDLRPTFRRHREHIRHLYSAVVHLVMMYGAPVWNNELIRKNAYFDEM